MIIKFSCKCGNKDVKKAFLYHGSLGYEALICKCCGSYSDEFGTHKKDKFSTDFINKK